MNITKLILPTLLIPVFIAHANASLPTQPQQINPFEGAIEHQMDGVIRALSNLNNKIQQSDFRPTQIEVILPWGRHIGGIKINAKLAPAVQGFMEILRYQIKGIINEYVTASAASEHRKNKIEQLNNLVMEIEKTINSKPVEYKEKTNKI